MHQAESAEGQTAPPKQVAKAMERLTEAGRLIADIRLGADRLLEALFEAASSSQPTKPLQFILNQESSMRGHLQDLRVIGKQLEESGVLNDSLRARSNSWGLHMPLVCPDGAVVAYAWKRQLAGQAGASAVDRTRLALKAFTDQKKRFFPHLDDDSNVEPRSKKHSGPSASVKVHQKETNNQKTVSDILMSLEKDIADVKTYTYQRVDWLKRSTSLPSSANENPFETSNDHTFHVTNISQGSACSGAEDKVALIELLFPSVFRVVVSLHSAGSIDPDAVAFFSPDEGGSYVHAHGFSVHQVFRRTTEHAAMALRYFVGVSSKTALQSLLHWICSYKTLFTKGCSKCGRLLSMDKQSALLLPPVIRPYMRSSSTDDHGVEDTPAFHIGCFAEGQ
ncbi:transcription cofactor [Lithospermum erythrorhizon]|uniref:Transcription cofactor n=1 Tax=Lithospermum erythrorhizon TaxID=34254 RepID=A0AAV3PBV1_LITER